MFRLVFASIIATSVVTSTSASADSLYRWQEPDGTITFSTEPPPAGTAFERVGNDLKPMGLRKADDEAPSTVTRSPSLNSMPGQSREVAQPTEPDIAAPLKTPVATAPRPDPARQRQCSDMRKRVVSLEQRLRNRLSAEEMDNTVLYMARYQQSIDRHCGREPSLLAAE